MKIGAVVVGIEKYRGLGDLNGPANDACEFAKWLCDKQAVPLEHIHLFVSPLEKKRDLPLLKTLPYKDATRENIVDFIETRL
jgi:hypothetical protein